MNEAMVKKSLQACLSFGKVMTDAPPTSVTAGDLHNLVIWVGYFAF